MIRIPQARAFEVAAAVDDWERHNAEALIELACRVPADRTFRAREVNLQLSRVGLARVSGTAHTVARDEALVASRPLDAIALYATLKGDAVVEFAGSRTVVRPGQLLVCDVDRPFQRGFKHGLEELAVKVPRAALADTAEIPEVTAPLLLDVARDPYARALVSIAGRALSARVPMPADEQAVLELVTVLGSGGRVGPSSAHRAAARAFIDARLTDPALSAADVAAGVGISERHLSRVFAEAGTSVPRHILARRLDLSYSVLLHGSGPGTRTVDAAARCGFTSMSRFSREFRRRFGVSAGDVRRENIKVRST